MDYPKRKPNRLTGYDYSTTGAYFVTLCTKNNEMLFWNDETEKTVRSCILTHQPVGADRIRPFLSTEGKIVDRAIQDIPFRYQNVTLDHYVIMPNHIHLLLQLTESQNDSSARSVSGIVGQTKRRVSKEIGSSVWQKSFHDHIVRDEADWQRIWTYIENNPANWESDCFYR
ncbi:MAG: transposase [Clostridia bacterium]|nr:transposase [Clostridia bacterium]